MKKIVLGFVLAFAVFSLQTGIPSVFAEGDDDHGHDREKIGILPSPDHTVGDDQVATVTCAEFIANPSENAKKITLGNKIKGGCVELSDIPFLVIHLIDICTKLAGTIAVIFLLYAGFQMIVSGVSDDREAAKNTIKYALTGLVVSFLAWVIVNLVQVQLTS